MWGRLQTCCPKSPLSHCHLHIRFHETPRLFTCLLIVHLNLCPDSFVRHPPSTFSVIGPCLYSFIPFFSTPLSYTARVLTSGAALPLRPSAHRSQFPPEVSLAAALHGFAGWAEQYRASTCVSCGIICVLVC